MAVLQEIPLRNYSNLPPHRASNPLNSRTRTTPCRSARCYRQYSVILRRTLECEGPQHATTRSLATFCGYRATRPRALISF